MLNSCSLDMILIWFYMIKLLKDTKGSLSNMVFLCNCVKNINDIKVSVFQSRVMEYFN